MSSENLSPAGGRAHLLPPSCTLLSAIYRAISSAARRRVLGHLPIPTPPWRYTSACFSICVSAAKKATFWDSCFGAWGWMVTQGAGECLVTIPQAPVKSLHDAQTRACPLRWQPAWTCHSSACRRRGLRRVQERLGPIPGSLHQSWASNPPRSPLSIPPAPLGSPVPSPRCAGGCWRGAGILRCPIGAGSCSSDLKINK